MSTKIKILVVSNYSNTLSARPEAEIFLKLAALGVKIDIVTDKKSHYASKFIAAGITVIDHTPRKKISLQSISLFKNMLTTGKHDLLLLYNSKAIINGLISAMFLKTKVILYRGCAGNISSWDPFAYLKYLNPRVDKVICNAESAALLLQKQSFFVNHKAITIHKGHDASWYNNENTYDLSLFSIPKNAFVVCCTANARPVKGVRFLIESMKYIGNQYPVHFIIMGTGHEDKINLKLINSLERKNNIHLVGFRKDNLSIIKSGDAFVLPSVDQETLTKSVIEAMSLGVTSIITDVPGNKILIDDRKTGLIVPTKNPKAIADAIIYLHDNPDKSQALGVEGKKHIEQNLSNNDTAQKYLHLFNEMLSR
ncbi:MAG: glycosyltransferase involved in cell wall biosynthesis [Glaciecola sp.]|jgi:glycosyltransferase involved in cell wall biosynthesis